MLRIVYVFRRLDGLSRRMCRRYWFDVHAGVVKKNASILGIRGYSQMHTLGNAVSHYFMRRVRKTMAPFDGTAEYWIDRDKLAAALNTEEGRRAMDELVKDEARFIDFSRSSLWLASEHPILDDKIRPKKPPYKKMTWVGSPLPGMTPQQFKDHYLDRHAPLVSGFAPILGMHKYVQIHTVDDPLNEKLRSMRGTCAPYLVHAEFIWDFKEMFKRKNSKKASEAMKEIGEDEKRFIDFSRSAIWTAKEHVIIPC